MVAGIVIASSQWVAHGSSTDRRIVRRVQLLHGDSTADLEAFLNELFKAVRICAAPQST
jgi:hypothetical protein